MMKVLTVSQVNFYIKSVIDSAAALNSIYISGEISNFKSYPSGHMYFTLKDEKAQMKCVMFSSANIHLKFRPENGMKVICFGRVSVYERDGAYQLYVQDMQPQGIGSLTIAYEQLKEKLEKEGLFDSFHKKKIPSYPKKIGVVTSNMGAAVEDIKNILARRYPLCEVLIAPTIVQGDAASADIVRSIEMLDRRGDIDVMIVGRGGGSIEDLWAFNTEAVARAVFHCKTPIISAVGHETDYTICDFVADLRAPTPSAAAELATLNIDDEKINMDKYRQSLSLLIRAKISKEELFIQSVKENSLLSNPNAFYDSLLQALDDKKQRLHHCMHGYFDKKEKEFSKSVSVLNALSPLNVMARGYAILKKDSQIIKNAQCLCVDDEIEISAADAVLKAKITEVKKNEQNGQ